MRSPVSKPRHSRFGYDDEWWGRAARASSDHVSYWSLTKRPVPSLVIVLPLVVLYEVGVYWLATPAAIAPRSGLDTWLRHGLAQFGITERWIPPALLVLGLVAWQAYDRRPWRLSLFAIFGMMCESLLLAVSLVGLSRFVDFGLGHLEHAHALVQLQAEVAVAAAPFTRELGFLGAGIYEEAIFRLLMIPLVLVVLRLLLTPPMVAGALAVTGSALLFSIAHYAGTPGEAFTWYAFVFRWFAGVYFAWVFVARGFGIAVGTHVVYDFIVGLSQ